jgi:hypothetical protein
MDGIIELVAVMVLFIGLFGMPTGALIAILALLGVRDRRARAGADAMFLAWLALVTNLAVCGVFYAEGSLFFSEAWFYCLTLPALAASMASVWLCLKARFA